MRAALGLRPGTAEAVSPRAMLLPLALAQFIASYDTSSMNVAISDIAADLDTSVTGVQTAITLFTLVMAAGMITGSRLTDIWGRRRCFQLGVAVYGLGALTTALSPTLGVMIIGWSVLEGLGSALMIPPIYILISVSIDDLKDRAKAFGVVSAMAAVAAAVGPLLGGFFATFITWRASFGAEVLVTFLILYLSLRIVDPPHEGEKPRLDTVGAGLSAAGMIVIVLGILQTRYYGWFSARKDFEIGDTVILEAGQISPIWLFIGVGLALLGAFALYEIRRERKGEDPLVPMRLFKNRASNLGLVTQNVQWLMLIGTSFVVAIFLQVSQGYSAIKTGLILTPATGGLLLSSALAGRFARKYSQRALIVSGFVLAEFGLLLLFLFVDADSGPLSFAPGLFVFGVGAGIMVTASVNVVQSSVPEDEQGAISGVSRSVSNLGSSLGTAIAGSVLVAAIIFGVTSKTEDSTVLDPAEKDAIADALEGDVSALSDDQVEAQLGGQPQEVAEEVVRINAESRDRALGFALLTIAVIGSIGLLAALLLPAIRPPPETPV
jgi:MFS family permease